MISGFTKSIEEVLRIQEDEVFKGLCAQNLEHKFNTFRKLRLLGHCTVIWKENQNTNEKTLKKEFMQSKEFLKLSGGLGQLRMVVKYECLLRGPVMDSITAWGGMDNATKTMELSLEIAYQKNRDT